MNKFPYEEKMIKEAMSLIDKNKVAEFTETEYGKIKNYLVVYSKEYDRFFGIVASRFLKNNYASTVILNSEYSLLAMFKRFSRKVLMNHDKHYFDNVQLFGYDEYLLKHNDDGFRLLEEYDSSIFDITKKITYAYIYLEYPDIRKWVQAGCYKLVEEMIKDPDIYTCMELMKMGPENLNIDKQCRDYLKKNEATASDWYYLHSLNNIDVVTLQQLTYLIENDISIESLYELVRRNDHYTTTSLINYINYCVIYQGYQARRVISDLESYNYTCRIYGIKSDAYPNDLIKVTKKANSISMKYGSYTNYDHISRYHYNYRDRKKYRFKDNDYYIKEENDIDKVKNLCQLFEGYAVTLNTKEDTDYFLMCDSRTDREVAVVIGKTTDNPAKVCKNAIKYNDKPLSKKEKIFIKKWLDYRKKIKLSLIQPQYNMV